ncbi:DMT family transporter [Cobetia marina]|jgi:DME family drug/metabolite transporter|uniref:DMT family transporter n=1 Tax=Cobetia marina TaxID=28258 RepID=UPI00384B4C8A
MQHRIANASLSPLLQGQTGNLCVLLAACLWGTTGTAAHFNQGVSPLATGAFAMGVGGVLQAILSRRHLRAEAHKLLAQKHLVAWGALFIICYPLAFYSAMEYTGVAMGTVITIATAPLAAAALEYLLDRKKVTASWYAALTLGMIGVALMAIGETALPEATPLLESRGEGAMLMDERKLIGIALGIVAGASYATYSLLARRMMLQGTHGRAAMGCLFGTAGVLLLLGLGAASLIHDPRLFATPVNASVAIYMALIPMLLASLVFGRGLASVPISRVTMLTMFEPLVAGVLAVVVVGEQFTMMGAVGMLLIMTCLMLQLRSRAPRAPTASPQPAPTAWARSSHASRRPDLEAERASDLETDLATVLWAGSDSGQEYACESVAMLDYPTESQHGWSHAAVESGDRTPR